MSDEGLAVWEARCLAFLRDRPADVAHDLGHVRRVVALAKRLAEEEGAALSIVVPAAWLHDCVAVPKDHPDRKAASRRAAEAAVTFLRAQGYPAAHLPAVAHAIEAHSFSAGIAPETLEARVVQDADRLVALGAVGLARMFALGGTLGSALFDADDPLAERRALDDKRYTLDHVFVKLLKLPAAMHTRAARRLAEARADYVRSFAERLAEEAQGAR